MAVHAARERAFCRVGRPGADGPPLASLSAFRQISG